MTIIASVWGLMVFVCVTLFLLPGFKTHIEWKVYLLRVENGRIFLIYLFINHGSWVQANASSNRTRSAATLATLN